METLIELNPISPKEANEYRGKATELTTIATRLHIANQEQYENAANLLSSMKKMVKDIDEARKKITSPLDQAKKAVMEMFKPTETALDNCIRHISGLIVSYSDQKERERQELEEKLRKQAEAEERKKREALEERARKADESGKSEKAEALREQAIDLRIIAPVLAPTVQKVSGLSIKDNWKARIIDENKVPRSYLIVDEQKLNSLARASKGTMVIPGVQFFNDRGTMSR